MVSGVESVVLAKGIWIAEVMSAEMVVRLTLPRRMPRAWADAAGAWAEFPESRVQCGKVVDGVVLTKCYLVRITSM